MSLETPGFREIAHTGVIYVTNRAIAHGFEYNHPEWSNLGQGSPETGAIAEAPARIEQISVADIHVHQYSPVAGDKSLRQKVADFYNENYRQTKASLYTANNVCIAGGGRQALSRLIASLGNINMGHFLPDYTAYEELLSTFKSFTPIPILLEKENNYRISTETLAKEIMGRGLRSLLISNPCNPTGQLIEGNELKQWVEIAREHACSMIMDEFYSHYIFSGEKQKLISSAEYIQDVNKDPVIIVDGLTKNWRYPGWRVSWIVGPEEIIKTVSSAGSFLDGGANHAFQISAQQLLETKHSLQEAKAIYKLFLKKRNYTMQRLQAMGIKINASPQGGFYVWADLSGLPEPINNSKIFFEEGLKEKVITVPGFFFDVNPSGRRIKYRRYTDHCRISFGPEMKVITRGLDALERVIKKFT